MSFKRKGPTGLGLILTAANPVNRAMETLKRASARPPLLAWENDRATPNGQSSMEVLIAWLVRGDNYKHFRAQKAVTAREIVTGLEKEGITHRTAKGVLTKIRSLERKYVKARKWLQSANIRCDYFEIRGIDDRIDSIVNCLCPYYRQLLPVFDRFESVSGPASETQTGKVFNGVDGDEVGAAIDATTTHEAHRKRKETDLDGGTRHHLNKKHRNNSEEDQHLTTYEASQDIGNVLTLQRTRLIGDKVGGGCHMQLERKLVAPLSAETRRLLEGCVVERQQQFTRITVETEDAKQKLDIAFRSCELAHHKSELDVEQCGRNLKFVEQKLKTRLSLRKDGVPAEEVDKALPV